MKLKIDSRIAIGVLIFFSVCLIACFMLPVHKEVSLYELDIIEVEKDKYGYKITRNKQIVIYQPFIPGLSERAHFLNPQEARRVGSLVKERLERNKNVSVTKEDLKKLGITYSQ